MTYQNTKKRGLARVIILPFSKGYKAVCLDFDLIEEAETFEEVNRQIRESVTGYIENVFRNNLPDELLNRPAEARYWEMFEEYSKYIAEKKIRTTSLPRNAARLASFSLPISLCSSR